MSDREGVARALALQAAVEVGTRAPVAHENPHVPPYFAWLAGLIVDNKPWEAVHAAIVLAARLHQQTSAGVEQGREIGALLERTGQLLEDMAPDATRGRKVREAGALGGAAKRRGPEDSELCEQVRALHERWPHLSWSSVCERVGQQYKDESGKPLSRQRVAIRAKPADWRK